MKKKRADVFLVLIVLATLLFGCAAGKEYYELGLDLQDSGKNKEAIAYLEQAIAEEPNNKEYQRKLKELKHKLLSKYISEARHTLSSSDTLTLSVLNEAEKKLKSAQEVDPRDPAVQKFKRKFNSAKEKLIQDTESTYNRAQESLQNQNWVEAYFRLQNIQNKYPNYEDTSSLIYRCQTEGSRAYLEQGRALYEQGKLTKAGNALQKCLSLDPANKQARKLFTKTRENNNKSYFLKKARQFANKKAWGKAITSYEKALSFEPKNNQLKQMLHRTKVQAGNYYIDQGQNHLNQGLTLKAIRALQQADSYMPDRFSDRITTFKHDIASQISALASWFEEQENWGSSWFWYNELKKLDMPGQDAFQELRTIEENIKQNLQKSIAVFDFNSPKNNPDAGIIVANNLITFLFNTASRDIKILERENLKSILEEMKLGQTGVVSAQSAQHMGRVYGIDVAIMGSVLLYKVDSSTSKGFKSVSYKVGEKIEDNIEYLNWKAKNPNPSDEKLAEAPQAKIIIPQMTEKDYAVANHKKVGFVQISFRIVDVQTGENIQVKTIERKKTLKDKASAGLKIAGIEYDPMELPTDTELLQDLSAEVVTEMGREALQPLRELEKTYFQKAEQKLKQREKIQAVENYAKAILDLQMKRSTQSPIASAAYKSMEDIFLEYKAPIRN